MESTTRTRKPYAKTVERRSAIARAALDIVLEKGHRALTTSEVASRSGMSETAMLYHFPTRDHILVAAMELANQDSRALLTQQFLGSDGQRHEWPSRALAGLSSEDRAVTRLFFALSAEAVNPDHPAHNFLKDHQERAVAEFAKGIQRRQADGFALPGLDPQVVARQVVAVWSGLRLQWLINPTFDVASEVSQAFKALTGQPVMEVQRKITEVISQI